MPKILRVAAANWRTTTAAILAAVVAVANAVLAIVDGNPVTEPDWNIVVTLLITACGLFFARDARVTSKQLELDK